MAEGVREYREKRGATELKQAISMTYDYKSELIVRRRLASTRNLAWKEALDVSWPDLAPPHWQAARKSPKCLISSEISTLDL